MTLTQAANEPAAPTTAGSGSDPPRNGTESGMRKARCASFSR